ncbi:MAG: hypothetical protein KKB50_15260 [Planctomycetes bacterium]|nr:hypothetical protein [Planctomycetota bacterium]
MSKRKSINVVVVTPERKALEVSTHAAVIPAHDGELGILTDRAPAMCELGIGQLRYEREGRTYRMFINGGFAQINENSVTVLTPEALAVEDITPERIAAAADAVADAHGHDEAAIAAREGAQRRLNVLRSLQESR